MPTPIDDLEREHALVRRALRALERIAAGIEAGLPFPAGDVVTLLRFFREFVEGVHHAKEAGFVHPAAVMLGGEEEAGSAGLLVRSHEETRSLLHSLVLFWEPDGVLQEAERRAFVATCRTYASRLRRHMETEEDRLFRIVRHRLPADDRLAMAEEFAALEARRGSAADWEDRVQALVADWCD